jgi:hypothetical protein
MHLLFCEILTAIFTAIFTAILIGLFCKTVTYIRKKLQYFIKKETFTFNDEQPHTSIYNIIGMAGFSVSV